MKIKKNKSFMDAWNRIKNKCRLIAELYSFPKEKNTGYSKNYSDYYNYEYDNVYFHLYMKLDKVMEERHGESHYELWENEQYYVIIVQTWYIESGLHGIYIYQKH